MWFSKSNKKVKTKQKLMESDYQRHALITGATSGIGYELAKLFAKAHYNLILVARSGENLRATKDEIGKLNPDVHIHLYEIDLFEPKAAEKIYEMTQSSGIRVDVLVNNAGQGEWGKFTTTELQREIDIVQLNVIAMMTLTKLFLKDMVSRNSGKILQLASSVSKAPSPYLSVYAATKAFVLSLTEALRKEVEGTDITITALQPGATDTDFFHKAKAENTVTYTETSLYTPEEVAKAGFAGLMNGDMTVVPGIKNKTQGILNTIMPDSAVTASMEKQMERSSKATGNVKMPEHLASARERKSINAKSGSVHGDY
jgi:short-subunit dehydrogenase